MAQQTTHQNRPFVAKQIFDQVSAVMWGQNALDYQTNYTIPRENWDDSDIREEASYFTGLATGLRLGASQNAGQPTMHHGSYQAQPNASSHRAGHYQPSYYQPGEPAAGDHGSFGTMFPHLRAPKPYDYGHPYLASNQQDPWNGFQTTRQHYAPYVSSFLTREDQANMGQATQGRVTPYTANYIACVAQAANSAGAGVNGQIIAPPFGASSSAPDANFGSGPPIDSLADRTRVELPLHQKSSQPSAVNTLFEVKFVYISRYLFHFLRFIYIDFAFSF